MRRQHPSFEFLNRGFGHIGEVNTVVVVFQKNSISPTWPILLNCFVELVYLLNVDFCIECFDVLKQFVRNYAFPVLLYTRYGLPGMKVLFFSRSCLFVGAEPFFSLLHIGVKAPFFTGEDSSVKKTLFVIMC